MKQYLSLIATFLLGNETRELFDEPNPLKDVNLADIYIRAQALIDSNLEDEADYIRQAVIIVSSEYQWRDDRLGRSASIRVFDTEDGQRTFEELDAESVVQALEQNDRGNINTHGSENALTVRSKEPLASRRPLKRNDYDRFERDFKHARIWQRLWHQSRSMKWLMLLCGIGAAVQGWDEAAVNGAQVYYTKAYGFGNDNTYPWQIGLINGAPYLCCFISCWLSWPLNKWLGRKNTIALSALLSMAFALAQAFANDWKTMFTLRFCMGFGIGPKSATIPIYASEIAPADLRGSLVMIWQLFTALGIMFGYLAGVAFTNVLDGNAMLTGESPCATEDTWLSFNCSLNWRLMIASPFVAPAFLMVFIFFAPESPRWLIARAQRKQQAIRDDVRRTGGQSSFEQRDLVDLSRVFRSLNDLRDSKIKAARDILIIDVLLSEQRKRWEQTANQHSSERWFIKHKKGQELHKAWNEVYLLFSNTRDFSALRASTILMFLQQYCGINVLIYYSTLVIFDGENGASDPLKYFGLSAGVGLLNFLCGLPAILLIDRVGRRKLLLWTFPFLALFEIFVGIGKIEWLSDRIDTNGLVLCGMYLFVIAYSSGEGPVPFVYASESFQQATRDLGMGVVTSINWGFNFLVAFTFPLMSSPSAMTSKGTFWFYGAWCIAGFFLILLFVPETSKLELEQLDDVFSKTWRQLAREHWRDFWGPKISEQDGYGRNSDTANTRLKNGISSPKHPAQMFRPVSRSDSHSFVNHGMESHELRDRT